MCARADDPSQHGSSYDDADEPGMRRPEHGPPYIPSHDPFPLALDPDTRFVLDLASRDFVRSRTQPQTTRMTLPEVRAVLRS